MITGPMRVLRLDRQPAHQPRRTTRDLPSISVVIPVRSNEKTIRAAVESILRQDYPLLKELLLVGSPNDSTWSALQDIPDHRLLIIETETPPGIRDANFKRGLGIRETSGDLVSLIDSDMVIPSDWMSTAVRLLTENEVDCVAGVMRSIRDDFWGRFVDSNRLSAKTPRAKTPYLVTAEGFGAAGYKPPITADILFTRKMYQDCPIDSTWSHGSLEDYEWFWRVVERGHQVLVSNKLFGWHHHRSGVKNLAREYRRSARGCAYFIRAHRNSPFAQKRMTQAIVLPLAAFGLLLAIVAAALIGHAKLALASALALAATVAVLLSAREFARSRTLESLLYPIPALALGLNYVASLATHLIRSATMHAAASTARDLPALGERAQIRRKVMRRLLHPLTFILVLQAALSLSLIWSNTAFTDEADYLWVGRTLIGHVLHGTAWPTTYAHGTLSGLPFLYPPLGAAADMIGGLAGARILSLIFMLLSTIWLYSATKRLFDKISALSAVALWAVFSPTIQLGAFATYDALSVSLTVCAAWLGVCAATSPRRGELVAATGVVLALAEVTAYSGIVMIPVVIAFVFLAWWLSMGARQAAFCSAWATAVCVLVFCVIMTLCKTWPGIMTTVISRNVAGSAYASPSHVFNDSWTYSGIIAVLGVLGAIFALHEARRVRSIQVSFLAAIALVVPLAQAHDSTATALKKHLAYGAIFAVMAAGYGLARLARALPAGRLAACACCVVALVYPAVNGLESAGSWYHSWPNDNQLLSSLEPLLSPHSNVAVAVVDGDYICPYYYAGMGNDWENCGSSVTISSVSAAQPGIVVISYPTSVGLPLNLLLSPRASQSDFLGAINEAGGANTVSNSELPTITKILETSGKYRLVATGPYDSAQSSAIYTIWLRANLRSKS